MPGNPQIEARLYCGLNSCGEVYGVWENHCVEDGGREKAAFSGDFGGLPRQHFALWRTALCFDSGIMVHRYWVVVTSLRKSAFLVCSIDPFIGFSGCASVHWQYRGANLK